MRAGETHQIRWSPPEPRPGLAGAWDRFVGPGATPAEQGLALGFALLAGLGVCVYAWRAGLGWTPGQHALAGLLAFDLTGGVLTNATSSAKRWYHRPSETRRKHLGFIAVHAAQILLVAWGFRGMDWAYLGGVFGLLMLSAVLIVLTPLYLQRSVALLFACVGLLASLYVFSPTPGLEWFIPVLFIKLLVSHLLFEAPFTSPRQAAEEGDAP
ncbi:hypothetical protein KKF91_05940 [Myxococcota bacterium]|nr:hypothetical protein [Myxococcota bacterium]MBU1430092.1 hypothetical protein [Myxococcota bacterium]MBU1899539.1 hypothetical protein [Myxococcota bacterium]